MPYRQILQGLLDRAKKPEKIAALEAELTSPAPPLELLYILKAFNRIRRRKSSTGFGAARIEWPDLDAFLRLSKLNLAPWEIEVIEDLDDTYMAVQAETASQGDS